MSTIATTTTVNPSTQNPKQQQQPRTAREVIAASIHSLIEQLEAGRSEALTAYLDAMVHFRNYSFGNVLAIAKQRPQATNVAGMWTWNQVGRFVKKGEKGIAILAPMLSKARKEEAQTEGETTIQKSSLLGFRKVYVWDESQTEGAPLPKPEKVTGDVGAYLDRLPDYVIAQGITLEYSECIAPALGSAFGSTIRILPGQTKAEEFSTLVHELAHLMLKHCDRRTEITKTVRETEAEAIAFVVGKSIGLTTSTASADYISLYHGNATLLTESLELVQQTSAVILAAIQTEEVVSEEVPEAGELTTEAQPEPKRARRSRNQTTTDALAEVA